MTSNDADDESKNEREQALLDVIQAAGLQAFDLQRLLSLAKQAQFWRVCEIIYQHLNKYDLIIECYLNDRYRQKDIFRFIRTIWLTIDEQQRRYVQEKIFEHFNEIIEIDSMNAFQLFCIFFEMDLSKVLKLIGKNELVQYGILKVKCHFINNFNSLFIELFRVILFTQMKRNFLHHHPTFLSILHIIYNILIY